MSGVDHTAALRARRAQEQTSASGHQPAPRHMTSRPSDLAITSDMIPAPADVDATGELTSEEAHQLGVCESAVENLGTATWLAGKALQSIRDRKLYRQSHTRFDEYVEVRWEISPRAAYQMIEEWLLAETLAETLGKPAIASHTRALLPIAERFGLDAAADLYTQLRTRTAAEQVRLTAGITSRIVKLVLKTAGQQAKETQFREATQQLMAAERLPLQTKNKSLPTPRLQNFAEDHDGVTENAAARSAPHPQPEVPDDALDVARPADPAAGEAPDSPPAPEAPAFPVEAGLPATLDAGEVVTGLNRMFLMAKELQEGLAKIPVATPNEPDEAYRLRVAIIHCLRATTDTFVRSGRP